MPFYILSAFRGWHNYIIEANTEADARLDWISAENRGTYVGWTASDTGPIDTVEGPFRTENNAMFRAHEDLVEVWEHDTAPEAPDIEPEDDNQEEGMLTEGQLIEAKLNPAVYANLVAAGLTVTINKREGERDLIKVRIPTAQQLEDLAFSGVQCTELIEQGYKMAEVEAAPYGNYGEYVTLSFEIVLDEEEQEDLDPMQIFNYEQWQLEVADGETLLGYPAWRRHQLDASDGEQEDLEEGGNRITV